MLEITMYFKFFVLKIRLLRIIPGNHLRGFRYLNFCFNIIENDLNMGT